MILPTRIDEELLASSWPSVNSAPTTLMARDAVVVCAGFEDRATKFIGDAVRGGASRFRVLALEYVPALPENKMSELRCMANAAGLAMETQSYDRQEAADAGAILTAVSAAERIFIDVSGMSRLLIVQLFAASVRMRMLDRLNLIYTEAHEYPPTESDVAKTLDAENDVLGIINFISTGVFGVTVVPELSTVAMLGQPVRLIAFPSFNATQFATVCAEIQPATYCIINGVPPREQNKWRKEAIRRLNGIEGLRGKDEFDACTMDYQQTLRLLLRQYAAHGAIQKLVISPTGSKMQSVAVGIACGFLRDVQVVYPTPKVFTSPTRYTKGTAQTYHMSLGRFSEIALRQPELGETSY